MLNDTTTCLVRTRTPPVPHSYSWLHASKDLCSRQLCPNTHFQFVNLVILTSKCNRFFTLKNLNQPEHNQQCLLIWNDILSRFDGEWIIWFIPLISSLMLFSGSIPHLSPPPDGWETSIRKSLEIVRFIWIDPSDTSDN